MIYTITAIAHPDKWSPSDSQRVFGFYSTIEEAIAAVVANRGGMDEALYTHIVIEEVPPGVHALATAVQWFWWTGWEHDGADGAWQPCEPPSWRAGIINHSMG